MAKAKGNSQLVLTESQDIMGALKRNPQLIRFVDNPTEDMALAAVGSNGRVVEFIPEELQTEAVCNLAISRHRHAIKGIKNPTLDMMKAALQRDKAEEKPAKAGKKSSKAAVETIEE